MKFKLGPTYYERIVARHEWHRWFAWYPVRLGDRPREGRWLEYVMRKDIGKKFRCWTYKAMDNENE